MAHLTQKTVTALRELAKKNKTARLMFEELANPERKNKEGKTNLNHLLYENINRERPPTERAILQDVIGVAIIWHKLGLGIYMPISTNTPKHHFKWAEGLHPLDVARVALNMPPARPTNPKRSLKDLMALVWPRDDGRQITLKLPKDLSKAEANELGDFVKRFGK